VSVAEPRQIRGFLAVVVTVGSGITEREVRDAVLSGARTLDEVYRSCDGAGGDCGSCLARIERQLEGRFDQVQA